MPKLIIILLLALVLEAMGVVFLSKGLKQIGEVSPPYTSGFARAVRLGVVNPNMLLGVSFEALFFGGLLYLLTKADVSFVWPMTSLGFVITSLAAKFILHEEVSTVRWTGVVLIMLGAGLITWTEKSKRSLRTSSAPEIQTIMRK